MKKILFFAILTLASCSENIEASDVKEKIVHTETDELSNSDRNNNQIVEPSDNSERVQVWLEQSIGEYFDQDLTDWSFMTTSEYNEYKIDMINSIYSHGIELDSLKKKWSYKYEVVSDRTGVGFLIGAQDYINITIKNCKSLPSNNRGEYLFKIILCDTGYDECYESDVTVIEYNNTYVIDNVKEYFR